MLNSFFIFIGEIVLSTMDFFKNISFKNIELKKENNGIDSAILSKLDLNLESTPTKHETRFDEIRDFLVKILLKRQIILLLFIGLILIALFTSLEISAMYLVIILMSYLFALHYPQMKEKRGYYDLNQELPYALRHMSIELKAGRGLHDSLATIRNADYGSLSREFNRVLEEVKFGKATEDSLLEMAHRVKSEGLTRAIHQI
ncbi:type II secretion system F family protein, partial [Methanobrevibacter sp.]|uniref:type II secretion system F family protein n=1 Tax=Methanobrevibacter sp. TaxID=66852 RepID=UPI00386C61F0